MADSIQMVGMAWTWGSIFRLAFTTGLITAAFNQGFAFLKEAWQQRQKDRQTGQALAGELVEKLTSYAQDCNSRAQRNRAELEIGNFGDDRIPDLAPYDEQGAWGVLPPKIAGALRDLRNEVPEARRAIAETLEYLGPPEAIDTATYQLDHLGYMAFQIARRLRLHYGLGAYKGRSTFATDLRKRHQKNRQGSLRKLWQSLYVTRIRTRIRRWRWDRRRKRQAQLEAREKEKSSAGEQ